MSTSSESHWIGYQVIPETLSLKLLDQIDNTDFVALVGLLDCPRLAEFDDTFWKANVNGSTSQHTKVVPLNEMNNFPRGFYIANMDTAFICEYCEL